MALEVNEIGIRVRVRDSGDDEEDEEKRKPDMEGADCGNLDRAQIVDDCVRRVLRILEARQGR